MSGFRRAVWADDATVNNCTKCRTEFNYRVYKHHCRKCGLIFCAECSSKKYIIPQDDLVPRPSNWLMSKIPSDFISDEDNYRCPQRVCDPCSFQLKDIQADLRLQVSRANQNTVQDGASAMPNLPSLDFYMENEIKKAAAMLHCFKNTLGEEKIPKELLDIAKGVVFLTVVKAGFMFTGRYGTGLVVAKLDDGSWSAPSAVVLTGLGWGLQIGAELTDVMLILSTDAAVNTFKSRAQISVGAELGVSVGPIGRSIESDVTAGNKGAAHAFSYAQSKGLFFGASLEASGIAARPDVNRAFYGEKISPSVLLSGEFAPPLGAELLYQALDDVIYNGHPPPNRRRAAPAVSNARERYEQQQQQTQRLGNSGGGGNSNANNGGGRTPPNNYNNNNNNYNPNGNYNNSGNNNYNNGGGNQQNGRSGGGGGAQYNAQESALSSDTFNL